MLNSKKLKADLAAELDKVSAVNKLCDDESREPTSDEVAIVNAAIGADGTGGRVAELKAKIKQAEAFEAAVSDVANVRQANGVRHEQADPSSDSQGLLARVRIPATARSRAPITAFKGADAEREAYAFGRFVTAACGNARSEQWCRDALGIDIRNAMSSGSDADGGYLVPSEFEASIIRLVNEYGVARSACQIVPMNRDTKTQAKRSGGITAYAIGEIATPTASSPTYDMIQLVAKKFGALAYYSNDLSDDAMASVGNEIALEMALGFAYKEDSCLFNGDGTSTYNGINGFKNVLAAGSTYTAATGNTAFSTLDLEDFEGMVATLPSYAFMNGGPTWYIHRSGWAQSMLRLAAAAGGNTTRDIAAGASQASFLGYPVRFVEVLNNTLTAQTSTSGLCYFGNLAQGASFGDRRGLTVATSREVAFLTHQTAVLGTERFDIAIHEKGTASVAGSVVMLKTPGS